jgi:hypothetical protein
MLFLSSEYQIKQRGEGGIRNIVVCTVNMLRTGLVFEIDGLWVPPSLLFKEYLRLCLAAERPEFKISHSPPYTLILHKRFLPFRFLTMKNIPAVCVCVWLRPLVNFQGTWCECYTIRFPLNAEIYNYLVRNYNMATARTWKMAATLADLILGFLSNVQW